MQKAYDKFNINLSQMQVVYAQPGENWMQSRHQPNSPMHILKPIALNVQLYKAFMEDVSLPKWVQKPKAITTSIG